MFRNLLQLPVNIWLLSEAERKERLEKRKPKKKVIIDEDFEEDTYDSHEYLKYLKKWVVNYCVKTLELYLVVE